MNRILATFTTFLLLLLFSAHASAGQYKIDADHSTISFKVRHMMSSWVRGRMNPPQGTIQYDDANPSSLKIDIKIDASSINTDNEKRDKHLRSEDFLDVTKYPEILFVSKSIQNQKGQKFDLVGDLTIHGVTKEITLHVDGPTDSIQDPWGNTRRGASAQTTINRQDFGVSFNKLLETGGAVVGNDIHIEIDIELIEIKGE